MDARRLEAMISHYYHFVFFQNRDAFFASLKGRKLWGNRLACDEEKPKSRRLFKLDFERRI